MAQAKPDPEHYVHAEINTPQGTYIVTGDGDDVGQAKCSAWYVGVGVNYENATDRLAANVSMDVAIQKIADDIKGGKRQVTEAVRKEETAPKKATSGTAKRPPAKKTTAKKTTAKKAVKR